MRTLSKLVYNATADGVCAAIYVDVNGKRQGDTARCPNNNGVSMKASEPPYADSVKCLKISKFTALLNSVGGSQSNYYFQKIVLMLMMVNLVSVLSMGKVLTLIY